jgi:hypothetical protein
VKSPPTVVVAALIGYLTTFYKYVLDTNIRAINACANPGTELLGHESISLWM